MNEVKSLLAIKRKICLALILFNGFLCFSQETINNIDFYPNNKFYCDKFKYLPFPANIGINDSLIFKALNNEADSLVKSCFKKQNSYKDTIIIFTFAKVNSIDHFIIIIQKNNSFLKVMWEGILTKKKVNKLSRRANVCLKEQKLNFQYLKNYVFINNLLLNKCSSDHILSYDAENENTGALKYFVFENKFVTYNSEWFAFRF